MTGRGIGSEPTHKSPASNFSIFTAYSTKLIPRQPQNPLRREKSDTALTAKRPYLIEASEVVGEHHEPCRPEASANPSPRTPHEPSVDHRPKTQETRHIRKFSPALNNLAITYAFTSTILLERQGSPLNAVGRKTRDHHITNNCDYCFAPPSAAHLSRRCD